MNVLEVGKRSFAAFGEDKVQRLASAVAFSAIFSIAPLFIVLIAVLATFFGGHGAAQEHLLAVVKSSAGSAAAETLRQIIAASFNKPRQGTIAQIVGWATFVLGASNLFSSLQDALNSIWHVETAKGGWKQMVRDRIASSGVIVLIVLLVLAMIGLNAAAAYLFARFGTQIPVVGSPLVLSAVSTLLTLLLLSSACTLIFRVLPDVDIDWKSAWYGGVFTSVLMLIGQSLIGLYFTKGGVTSAYGAAGSLLVALLWMYYSVLIVLFGAEVTKIITEKAELSVTSDVRRTEERPAGSDPRPTVESKHNA